MLEDNLLHIKSQLHNRTRSKKALKKVYVSDRLSKSLQSYYNDIERRMKYLMHRKPDNVLKRL